MLYQHNIFKKQEILLIIIRYLKLRIIQTRTYNNMALSQAHKAIIGIMLINFATGFTNDWGVISIYFLSYFHFHGAPLEIKASTNSVMLIAMVIPVTICLIFSIQIAHKVGYVQLIRYCAIAFLFVPLLLFIDFNFVLFIICSLVIPASAYALSLPSIFHCLYSHFPESKSIATGVVIGSFSLGAIFWNLVITMAINPDNIVPDIQTGDPNLVLFTKQISYRVPLVTELVYLSSGIMFAIGSILISANQNYKQDEDYEVDLNLRHQVSQFQNPVQSQKQEKVQTSPNEQIVKNMQPQKVIQEPINIKQYLFQPIPLLLFVLNISGCLYQSYVQLNTKLVYMSFLQDDHLISVGLMITVISSAAVGLLWGLLADKKGPSFAIICFVILDLLFKIYSTIVRSRGGFVASMVLLGATDKTMLILFGPILIDCFGLAVATHMLPFKGLSGILTIMVATILSYIFSSISPEKALIFICFLSVLNLGIGGYLAHLIEKRKQDKFVKKQIKL